MPVLKRLKQYKVHWLLLATGNFSRRRFKSRFGYLYMAIQFLIVSALVLYSMFTFGELVEPSKWPRLIPAEGRFSFSKAHDVIWEQKWLLTYVFGLFYMRSGHFEQLLFQIRLPRYRWKLANKHGIIYTVSIAFMVILIPTWVHAIQLWIIAPMASHELWQYYLSIALFFVFRFVTLPSFCMVTCVLYLTKVIIDSLGETLKNINSNLGVPYAKRKIRVVKRIIRSSDTRLKWYLLLHLTLILLTAFTGLFSLLEKMEFKATYEESNRTSVSTPIQFKIAGIKSTKLDFFQRELALLRTNMEEISKNITVGGKTKPGITSENNSQTPNNSEERLARNSHEDLRKKFSMLDVQFRLLRMENKLNAERQSEMLVPAKNTTTTTTINNGPSHFTLQFSKVEVLIVSLMEMAEIIGLFLVPLLFLAWHERAIRRITDEFFDIDEEEQRQNYLLVDCVETKSEILSVLKSMRGVSIFGMQISFYKAGLFAVLTPFLTAILHTLFKQFQLY